MVSFIGALAYRVRRHAAGRKSRCSVVKSARRRQQSRRFARKLSAAELRSRAMLATRSPRWNCACRRDAEERHRMQSVTSSAVETLQTSLTTAHRDRPCARTGREHVRNRRRSDSTPTDARTRVHRSHRAPAGHRSRRSTDPPRSSGERSSRPRRFRTKPISRSSRPTAIAGSHDAVDSTSHRQLTSTHLVRPHTRERRSSSRRRRSCSQEVGDPRV